MVKSYPNLNFKIIHGIQRMAESYFSDEFKNIYTSCTSKDSDGDFNGRVTDYLKENSLRENSVFFLCGNFDMIYDVQNILKEKMFSINNIFTEAYF